MAWNDSGYAYAKASWIVGKSFLGKKLFSLNALHTLNELDRLIFPELNRELPGRELLIDMERRIIQKSVRQILSIVNSFAEPPKLLVRMLRSYEYSDLKECLANITSGKKEKPVICDIGRFKTIRFEHYPDIGAMLKKTEYETLLLQELKSMDLSLIETKLDYRFYQGLIESLPQLPDEDRMAAARLIADEISLRNCVWALRLRTYYQKSEAETAKYLLDFKLQEVKKTSLASDAKASLDFPLDVRLPWRAWRWERFLNSDEHSWCADPRHFQNAASKYLYNLAFHNFHSLPLSISSIYCFIKLKQFEEDILTSVAEGLSLGMDSSNVFKLLEAA
ncbi:MAG: V-type ATPase subunit [Treponema sp.]|nr:V-type ATPase subunit [Treponema sp.]